jgi:transcriptional regulator with XRE-family HTH domain
MTKVTDQETKDALAANVNAILDVLGWSRRRLASEAGEQPMLISSLCNGRSLVNAASLKRVADALHVTVDRLFEQRKAGTAVPKPHVRKKSAATA